MDINQLNQLDNDALRAVLIQSGIDAGPVNDMTRKVYVNKLIRMMNNPEESVPIGDAEVNMRQHTTKTVEAKAKASNTSLDEENSRLTPQKSSTPSRGASAERAQARQRKGAEKAHEEPAQRRVAESELPTGKGNWGARQVEPLFTPAKQSTLTEVAREELRNRLSMSVKPRRPIDSFETSFESESFTETHTVRNSPRAKGREAQRVSRRSVFCGLTVTHVIVLLILFIITCCAIAYLYVGNLDKLKHLK